jgi:DNA modification methylase
MRQHEDILVFCKKTPTYYPQKSSGHKPMNAATNEKYSNESKYSPNYGKVKPTKNNAGSTERYPSSVLDFNVVNNDNPIKIHPTQKPVELLEWLIRTYSSENELVLDNTMGSGSTGIACAISNRRFIGIESNLQYFNHAKKWIQSIK